MKTKVRNRLAHLPILRKGGAHGKSKKAQRTLDKVFLRNGMLRSEDGTCLTQFEHGE